MDCGLKDNNKKNINLFLAVFLLFLGAILISLAFFSVDLEVADCASAVSHTSRTQNISGNWNPNTTYASQDAMSWRMVNDFELYHSSEEKRLTITVNISGQLGALYRNGAISVVFHCSMSTRFHDDDDGGMALQSGDGEFTILKYTTDASFSHALTATPTPMPGAGRSFKFFCMAWADDGTWGLNWDYNTHSYVTCTLYIIKAANDTTGPTVNEAEFDYPFQSSNFWEQEKTVEIKINDNLAGVDISTIKIDGQARNIASNQWHIHESGRSVVKIVCTVSKMGSGNLKIEAKDFYGNPGVAFVTIPCVDTAPPEIIIDLQTVDGLGTEFWTNNSVTIQVSVYDPDSGLKNLKIGDREVLPENTPGMYTGVYLAEIGLGTNRSITGSMVVDHALNERALADLHVYKIDVEPPELKWYVPDFVGNDNWTNSEVTVYFRIDGVSSDNNTEGVSPMRTTNPIEASTPGANPARIPNVLPASGTIGGFSYTHTCVMHKENGKIEYVFRAYDEAGNASETVSIEPNIDTINPFIYGVSLIGYTKDGKQVDAEQNYSYEKISVQVECGDMVGHPSGTSGISRIRIYETNNTSPISSQSGNESVFVFTDVISKDSIIANYYRITLEDNAGNLFSTTNGDKYYTIYPLKDATVPMARAVGVHDWENTENVGQNISVDIWTGLSGGQVYMKRTYLEKEDIKQEETRVAYYEQGINMYVGNSLQFTNNAYTYNVRTEGEEFYHFQVISGAGVSSGWKGLGPLNAQGEPSASDNGVDEVVATLTFTPTTKTWRFSGNGARTRIDNTPPRIIELEFTNGSEVVDKSRFTNINNYIAESITGVYSINDGISSGGIRTDGLNCSGFDATFGVAVKYTVTEGLIPKDIGLIVTDGAELRYDSSYSKAKFEIEFSNKELEYDGTVRNPEYTIYVSDRVGNVSTISIQPYIDDAEVSLEILTAETLESESTTKSYDYMQEHNWTNKPIMFKFAKAFGQSGARIAWFISTDKVKSLPTVLDEKWLDKTSSTWGYLDDTLTSMESSIRIPSSNSFDATIFFIIRSNAKKVNGEPNFMTLGQERVGIFTYNYYIAVDDSAPNLDRFEFKDDYDNVIPKDGWSPTRVRLYVYGNDIPAGEYTNAGSGIKDVKVNIRLNESAIIPMEMVDGDSNVWRSQQLLSSEEYQIVIEDHVGNKTSAYDSQLRTWAPKIDTQKPVLTITGESYDLLKGTPDRDATPVRSSVLIYASSGNIVSGGQLYYKTRTKSEFLDFRFTEGNIDLESQGWTTRSDLKIDERLSLLKLPYVTVGGEIGAEVHVGYDFVLVSGSGLMAHIEYGIVWVDRKAPSLNLDKIEYIRDDGLPAQNIIVPQGAVGSWTNAEVIAKLYIEDGENGSGLNIDSITLNGYSWDYTEGLSELNNGYYIFVLDMFTEYVLRYADNAGNEGSYIIKPLIDRKPVSIALNAIDSDGGLYNINPLEPGGVRYINKDITIRISLQFGDSSFRNIDIENSNFAKGVELYKLRYSLDGGLTFFNINEEMGTDLEWTNPLDGSKFVFVNHDNKGAVYQMVLTQDQDRDYYFEVCNGIEEGNISEFGHSPIAYPIYAGQTVINHVKIDQSPPTITEIFYVNNDNVNEALSIDQWTEKSIRAVFTIMDNEYGSGILEDGIRSVVVLKRDTDIYQTLIEKVPLIKVDGRYSFVMDGHYNYYIEYEDIVGNGKKTENYGAVLGGVIMGKEGGLTGPICPLIDSTVPNFSFILSESNGQDYILPNGDHPWTYNEVVLTFKTIVGLSGQRLQYQVRAVESTEWSTWLDVYGSTSQENGIIQPYSGLTEKITIMRFNNSQFEQSGEYRFRVVSGAGVISQNQVDGQTENYYAFGDILIDTIIPTITVTARSDNKPYYADTWANKKIDFTISVTRGKSGSVIEVSNNQSNWSTSNSTLGEIEFPTHSSTTLTRNFDSTSHEGDRYYFRVKSGAGRETIYHFGYVKKDEGTTLNVNATFRKINPNEIIYSGEDQIDYEETFNRGVNHQSNNWSSTYILIKLTCSIGNSGAYIKYSDETDTIANRPVFKDAYTATPGVEDSGYTWLYNGVDIGNKSIVIRSNRDPRIQDAYMLITENQNRKYRFRITSYSGVSKGDNREYSVMVDQTVPYMKLSINDDVRSVRWTDDEVADLHKWYTSEPIITFHVGNYVDGMFEYGYPISNATIYYKESHINDMGIREYKLGYSGGIETFWHNDIVQNNGYSSQGIKPTMKIADNVSSVKTYEFKIVTGAGLECEIVVEYSNPNNLEGKALWVKSLAGDEMGMYTIKVDTTEYTVNIEQWLKQYQELEGVNTDDMAEFTVAVNGQIQQQRSSTKNGIINLFYNAKRGDRISISLNEDAYDDDRGYGYIFKRVEFYGAELNSNEDLYISKFYVLSGPLGELFEFDIYNVDYNIMAYFTKEIKLDYQYLNQIMQIENVKPVGIVSEHSVSSLRFEVRYTGTSYFPLKGVDSIEYINSLTSPQDVGKYTIKVGLLNDNPNDPNYLIHNSGEEEIIYLTIVYFDNKGTAQEPIYHLFNQTDLEYINIYNDTEEKYRFLAESALNKTYVQQIDIKINSSFKPIYGNFVGVYDGNSREIYATETINAEGIFGIFERVTSEVKGLGVRLDLVNVSNATSVGFLTGSADGASITHCYSIGELHVDGINADIGGLVGHANNETFMSSIYADVAISNKGNMITGNIGGVVGKVDYIAFVYSYSLGPIELYNINVDEIKVGTLAGTILSTMEDDDLSNGNEFFYGNKYVLRNLFINECICENGGVGYLDNNVFMSGSNEIEGLSFSRFIIVPAIPNIENIANISISSVTMQSKLIKNLAIGKIRESGIAYGLGTVEDPFQIDTKEALSAIDRYVWGDYIQTVDIVFNSQDTFNTIAAHKVFYGVYDGFSGNRRYIIEGLNINTIDNYAGLFGKVSGRIRNVDIRNLNISMNYSGTRDAFAGAIAGKLDVDARLEYVFVVGNITVSAPNAKLYLGGIVGHMVEATLIDILSMANVITQNVKSLDIGGTIGYIKDSTAKKVYSLARVEGNYSNTGAVGAIIGTLIGQNDFSDSYALLGNAYAHSRIHENIVGNNRGTGFQGDLLTLEEMRTGGLSFMTDQSRDLHTVLVDVYPFTAGLGTANNPFLIYNIHDFNLISDFLYAHYKIKSNITFNDNFEETKFKTIGIGARFTGSISGAMSESEYQAISGGIGPRSFSLSGLTDSLVYYNSGRIQDLRLTINYDKVAYNNVTFGAVSIYNSGTIQSVYVNGTISLRINGNYTAIVGGFVGEDLGGKIISDYGTQQPSYELSSINEAKITVTANQINAGGFVGRITGKTELSYLVSEGDIECFGGSVLAGTIAGAVLDAGMTFENEIESSASVKINGVDSTKNYGFNISS